MLNYNPFGTKQVKSITKMEDKRPFMPQFGFSYREIRSMFQKYNQIGTHDSNLVILQ